VEAPASGRFFSSSRRATDACVRHHSNLRERHSSVSVPSFQQLFKLLPSRVLLCACLFHLLAPSSGLIIGACLLFHIMHRYAWDRPAVARAFFRAPPPNIAKSLATSLDTSRPDAILGPSAPSGAAYIAEQQHPSSSSSSSDSSGHPSSGTSVFRVGGATAAGTFAEKAFAGAAAAAPARPGFSYRPPPLLALPATAAGGLKEAVAKVQPR